MKNISYIKKLLLLCSIAFSVVTFAGNSVQLFSISSRPFTFGNGSYDACYLDLGGNNWNALNRELEKVESINEENFMAQHDKELKEFSESAVCKFKASILGVTKLPAIVFDEKYVVYGLTNINEAKQAFQNYQGSIHE